ncbi:RNA polymerase sigma-E factor, ECF-type, group 3 [Stanieria sp. NIES-3757]|nr:RNA polymerase sigma-E factor, ECF-type, group 3 [Stanieria sp. NIES-3757]
MKFQQLWQQYKDPLQQFLRSQVKNSADVDDLLQEIFIKTHQHLNTLKEPEKLRSWLFQITRNTVIDYYRKSRVETSRQDKVNDTMLTDEQPEQYEQIRQELTNCIRPLLERLPEKYREAIEIVDLQSKSQKELANKLGLSHSAVKSRVQRGRRMLQNKFHECCYYNSDVRGNLIDYQVKPNGC